MEDRIIKLKLHEIELNSKDPEASKKFYNDLLGIPINIDRNGLKCYDSGWSGLDIDIHSLSWKSIYLIPHGGY